MSSKLKFFSVFIVLLLLSAVFQLTQNFLPEAYASDDPPCYQNVGSNSTSINPGEAIKLYAQGYDDIGLDWAWLSTNETGTWKNYTFINGGVGSPSDIIKRLYQLFNYHYTNRISGTYLSQSGDSGTYLDYLGFLGLQIYLRDHNRTCLDIATNALQEAYDNRDPNTNLLREANSSGIFIAGNWRNEKQLYWSFGAMTLLNSTFEGYYQTLMDGLWNTVVNSTTGFSYLYMYTNGTWQDSGSRPQDYCLWVDHQIHLITLNYDAYRITGNVTYLNRTARMLDAEWKLRNVTTNLVPHSVHADENSTYDTFNNHYDQSAMIQVCAYLKRNGETIISYDGHNVNVTDILIKARDALVTYHWYSSGGRWYYRTNLDGSLVDSQAETYFASTDRALLMASEVLSDTTYMDNAKNDLINSYNALKDSVVGDDYGGIFHHSSSSSTNQYRLNENLQFIQTCYLFYNKYGNSTFKNLADDVKEEIWRWIDTSVHEYCYKVYLYSDGTFSSGGEVFSFQLLIDEIQNQNDQTILSYIPPANYYSSISFYDPLSNDYFAYKPDYYLNGKADTWIWVNFTWCNSSIPLGTTIAWRIYFKDTSGNITGTEIQTFKIGCQLVINSVPSGVSFTINGTATTTPYSEALIKGTYTITLPFKVYSEGKLWTFSHWEDDANEKWTRTIQLTDDTTLAATYSYEPPEPDYSKWLFNPYTILQYFFSGDFLGAFQALYVNVFHSVDLFYAMLLLLFTMPIYIRTKSLTFLSILWILIGSIVITVVPSVAGMAVLFLGLGIGGLLFKTFMMLKARRD